MSLIMWWAWSPKPSATAPVAQPVEIQVREKPAGPGRGGRKGGLRAFVPRDAFVVVRRSFTEDGDTSGWRDQHFGAGAAG